MILRLRPTVLVALLVLGCLGILGLHKGSTEIAGMVIVGIISIAKEIVTSEDKVIEAEGLANKATGT